MRPRPTHDDPWAPYAPSAAEPWDRRRVVHLHRRAGFGATWEEAERDLADGPGPSVDRLLTGLPDTGEFEATAARLADAAMASPEPGRLKGWWAYRMLRSPDPLGERLTLMWHDHFATANRKVDDLGAMRRQNEAQRRLARGPFAALLGAMLRDPALLAWLDAAGNTREHPNENLARELMELFTLGVGRYAALTGWRVVDGRARFVASRHDDTPKAILGRTGPAGLDELLGRLIDHPATPLRLAWRLCKEFLGESTAPPDALRALADGLRANDLDIGWGVATILRSGLFHGGPDLGARVAGPAEFVVGAARSLGLVDPAPSTPVLADAMARLGQDLLDPPNVGGWPGGRAWITTRSALGRAAYASMLVGGLDIGLPEPVDPCALAARHGRAADPTFFPRLLLGLDAPAVPLDDPESAHRALSRLLASPEAQRT